MKEKGRALAFADRPEVNIFIFAVLLNYPWELIQTPLFEGMATAPHWDAVKICTRATLGDGIIMLIAYWSVSAAARNRWWFMRPSRYPVIGFIAVGLVITILLEMLAIRSIHPGWGWQYAEAMPTLPGIGVGLTPLFQWLILPPLALWIVRRQLERAHRAD